MYKILPSDYYWRGKEKYKEFEKLGNKDLLFYSALEYRNCIERILFDQLYLLKINDLPKKFEKLYRVKDLSATIIDIEPEFFKKLEFINIYLEVLGIPSYIFIPDLNYLNQIYGKLGNFLHSLKDPEKTVKIEEWWDNFISVLKEADEYIVKIIGGFMGSFDLNINGLSLFNKWKQREISDSELKVQIRRDLYSE